MTHRDLIRKLGGPVAVARKLKLPRHDTALHWMARGIPSKHWVAFSDLCAAEGIEGVTPRVMSSRHPSAMREIADAPQAEAA